MLLEEYGTKGLLAKLSSLPRLSICDNFPAIRSTEGTMFALSGIEGQLGLDIEVYNRAAEDENVML